MLTFILLCLLVGSVVGFLAGLFGIGGGLIMAWAYNRSKSAVH